MDLQGKTVVVTGSASGLGKAIAQAAAAKGATAVVTDLPSADIDGTVKSIEDEGGAAIGIACDVTDEAQVTALMEGAVKETGRLDVCVANAGVMRDGYLVKVDRKTKKVKGKMSLEQWNYVIDVNLTGMFLTVREAAAQMVDCANGGVIIPMSSLARHGNLGQTNYSASKAGVAAMTVVWSKELIKFDIRVAGIAPGLIETPLMYKEMKPHIIEMAKRMIPVGRLGRPEEIAHSALYIVENDLVTGIVIDVAGGIRF